MTGPRRVRRRAGHDNARRRGVDDADEGLKVAPHGVEIAHQCPETIVPAPLIDPSAKRGLACHLYEQQQLDRFGDQKILSDQP